LAARYALSMQRELETNQSRTPILRKAVAGVVLIVGVALALKIVVGFLLSIVWIVAGIAVVVAVLWALKTLLW
jgi:hypothetical protein